VEIPSVIGKFSHLWIINFGNNQLTGTIPPLITNIILDLYLYNNSLTGSVPSLAKLIYLQNIDLTGNSFDINTCIQLTSVRLQSCKLPSNFSCPCSSIPPICGTLYCPINSPSGGNDLSFIIVGVVVGFLFMIAIFALVVWFRTRNKNKYQIINQSDKGYLLAKPNK